MKQQAELGASTTHSSVRYRYEESTGGVFIHAHEETPHGLEGRVDLTTELRGGEWTIVRGQVTLLLTRARAEELVRQAAKRAS